MQVYQVELRKKGGNKFKQGITKEQHFGTNPIQNTGVPIHGFKGDPKDTGRGQFGVPIPGTGSQQKIEPQTPHCTAITKAGNPCKARPIVGQTVCIGHSRQVVEIE